MNNRTFLILGGYGNTGQLLARLLLQETDVRLVLAGRSIEKAEVAAAQFNSPFQGNRVAGAYADASDIGSLKQAFKGVDFVAVASSTSEYVREVATAALETGIDYLDIQYSCKKTAVLKSLSEQIQKAGCCFITDGGFHPGLPAALVRYGSRFFDRMDAAVVGTLIQFNWGNVHVSEATKSEFVEELANYQALFYRDGAWEKASMWSTRDFIKMDMGEPFGTKLCAPMFFEEMSALPELYPSIRHTGAYIAGFNWFADWIVSPLVFATLKLFPRLALTPMAKLMFWSWKTFSKPPYGTVLKLEASGEKDNQQKSVAVRLSHEDGYLFTAIPVAACLLQYLDGSIRKPGLWYMGSIVEPERLMGDMERMGVARVLSDRDGQLGVR